MYLHICGQSISHQNLKMWFNKYKNGGMGGGVGWGWGRCSIKSVFLKGLYNSQENTFLATYYPFLFHTTLVTSWCSGYHYCTNSLDKRCSRRVGDSQWWGMAGNEDKRVSSVSHAIKTIHHSSSPVLGSLF